MKIKNVLLALFGILSLGSCGLLKDNPPNNDSFDMRAINKPGTLDLFGECKSITVDVKDADDGKWTIRPSDFQNGKTERLIWLDTNSLATITVKCDGSTEQPQTFSFMNKGLTEVVLYRKSSAPNIDKELQYIFPNSPILYGSPKGPFALIIY